MPIQCLFDKCLDQQEKKTVLQRLFQKNDEALKDDEKLFITNVMLEVLTADVEDLLRSIESENGLGFDQPDMCVNREINGENNEVDLPSTVCKSISSSAQPKLSIKEGHVSSENNQEDMLSTYYKNVLSSEQSDSCVKRQINGQNNQENFLMSTDKIIPTSKLSDLSFNGQVNCENKQEDFLKTDCKTVSSSEQLDLNIKRQLNCENDRENLQRTGCKTDSNSKQSNLSIKCRIVLEYQDLESLNEYCEDVSENNEDTNVVFQIRSVEDISPNNEV